MNDDLKRIARANGERGRVLAARVAVLSKLYRRDPARNHFLLPEVEHLARRVVYHMRQAVIVGALINQIEGKNGSRPRLPERTRTNP